jgi:2-oxo-3-hexenedioate decarboxylase
VPVTADPARALAQQILAAVDAGAPIEPSTDGDPAFGLGDGYRVASLIAEARVARGERIVGWKVGFTNRTIWTEYGISAPIWGPMYDDTVTFAAAAEPLAPVPVERLAEPRIEPEIAFRFERAPDPGMNETELFGCVDAVAHGFEIVQSVYPGWRFKVPDTVAACGLHGCYRCGPLTPVAAAERQDWLSRLADFEIAIFRDGEEMDRGAGANVLDGPLTALRHFVRGLPDFPFGRGIEPGDLVTTGTVTRAFPVRPGERWRTEVVGLPLAGIEVALA